MQLFFGIAYFVVGFVQIFAIADGIGYAAGVGNLLSFIIAAFLTYIPLVGAGFGVYGAIHVWDWSLLQALVLFFWYIPVFIVVLAIGSIFNR